MIAFLVGPLLAGLIIVSRPEWSVEQAAVAGVFAGLVGGVVWWVTT